MPAGQRCRACNPPWARPSDSWTAGSTRRWRRLRAAKLAANPLCQWPGCPKLADEVDHIRALALGGARYDWDNLQSLCHPHHVTKTADDARLVREAAQG